MKNKLVLNCLLTLKTIISKEQITYYLMSRWLKTDYKDKHLKVNLVLQENTKK